MTFDLATTDRLLSTTRAVRKRLDLERPVEREVILECLELAVQAPTGSNQQDWRFVVVTDADKRAALAKLYARGAGDYLDTAHAAAKASGETENERIFDSARYLLDVLHRVPVHVIPCIQSGYREVAPGHAPIGKMASIFPAVWSFQLALRSRGLGSCLTTLHLGHAAEAAALLGLPDDVHQVALLPVAYTVGTGFKPARRRPLDEVVCFDGWTG